jgi:hypothetical protein
VDPVTARALYAVQGRGAETLFAERVAQAAWHTKPCFCQVSPQDRTINPDLERFMAKRMKAKTVELNASHLGIISHPREIADLILAAAGHTT